MDGGDCNIPDAFLKTCGDNNYINKLSCLYIEQRNFLSGAQV